MAHHEFLGIFFASFQTRPFFGRAEYGHTRQLLIGFEEIVNTVYQRVFRAYDHKIYAVFEYRLFNSGEIVHFDRKIFSQRGSAGITGSHKQFAAERALRYFPCQGVFAAARTEDKYVHRIQSLYLFLNFHFQSFCLTRITRHTT